MLWGNVTIALMIPYSYNLPQDKIASRPAIPAESAKLLVYNQTLDKHSDYVFSDLPDLITKNDILVFNNSKVIPARFFVYSVSEPDKKIEIMFLQQQTKDQWLVLGKPMNKLKKGENFYTNPQELDSLQIKIIENTENQVIAVFNNKKDLSAEQIFQKFGFMPIPPYIRKGISDEQDAIDYQNVYAEKLGSIAAPTAGLHFSKALLDKLLEKNIRTEFTTLHVGSASFLPIVNKSTGELVPPTEEKVFIDYALINRLLAAKKEGKRIIAVGTTSVRALESIYQSMINADIDNTWQGTSLFIKPDFQFNIVDSLITNFHQPGTTHMFIIEAMLKSRTKLQACYQHALANNYRFLSYGDGMMIY